MTRWQRRLARLEWEHIRAIVAEEAARAEMSVDELLDEVWQFLALTDEEQRAELATLAAEYPDLCPREWRGQGR
jgi:hypothetical protein